MDTLVTIKSVKQAIVELQARGDRVSNRNIRQVIGGGSPNQILSILRQIEEAEDQGIILQVELPASLQSSILSGINALIIEATKILQQRLEKANAGLGDAWEELGQALERIEDLGSEVNEVKKCLYKEEQRSKELEKHISDLRAEREQLLESREIALTETAKAQLQVERADQLAAMYEAKLAQLEAKYETERVQRQAAEIQAATAEAKLQYRLS